MFEYTLTKRFAAACLVLVLALPCLSVFADEVLPPEETPPAASSEPAETPLPEETPLPSAEPGPSESPAPAETPPPSETPAPVETPPPPSETPAPTETPLPVSTETPPPTPTPAPPETLQPDYTVDSALDYLAENGIFLAAASAPDTTTVFESEHGMHRLYLGQTSTESVLTLDISKLLPDLYHRLTVDNFCALPASSKMISTSKVAAASSGSFTYDSSTGILTCPYLFREESTKGNACFYLFKIYCYYNDSVPAVNAEVPTVTTRSCLGAANVGSDIELPNFPGLHMRYLKNAASSAMVDGYLNETFPDLYASFSPENFGILPYGTLWSATSTAVWDPPIPYNTTTGHYCFGPCTGTENPLMSASNKKFVAFNYDLLFYYNVESEMVFEDPTPTPAPSDTPTAPVAAPHPFWTTPFEEYSVTEGMLLLILSLLALFAVVKVFRR